MTAALTDKDGRQLHTHGFGGYTRGCRCDECRAGKAAYQRTKRAQAHQRARRFTDHTGRYLAPGITHGSAAGYNESGCRCRPCTDAASFKRRQEEHRKRERERRSA